MRPVPRGDLCGVRVSFKSRLDGGGSDLRAGARSPCSARRGMPKVARAFEWCAGPQLHRLLAAGARIAERCSSPTSTRRQSRLPAHRRARRTQLKVTVHHSDNLEPSRLRAMSMRTSGPAAFRRPQPRATALSRPGLARASRLLRQRRAAPRRRRRGAAGEQCRLDAGHVRSDDRGRRIAAGVRARRIGHAHGRAAHVLPRCTPAIPSHLGAETKQLFPICGNSAHLDVIR